MPPNLGSAPGIPRNTFLLGAFTQGVPTTFLPQGPLTLETFRHTSILCSKSPPYTSLGSRLQEWQSGIRAEVTYLMSFSLQDCPLQEERAWAGPRAGAPPHCSPLLPPHLFPSSAWGQSSLITFLPNMVCLFLPLDLDFGLSCIPCLL